MRAMNFITHKLEWQHFMIHKQWRWRQALASPHGRNEPNSAESKTLVGKKEVGLCGELISHAMHGGGCSTCPLTYLVQSGSNNIVITTIVGTTNYC